MKPKPVVTLLRAFFLAKNLLRVFALRSHWLIVLFMSVIGQRELLWFSLYDTRLKTVLVAKLPPLSSLVLTKKKNPSLTVPCDPNFKLKAI